ncbi:BON domain-containing protein [uncultured Thiohalocapsa sp.]|uniref:BON domain-containing protein n=1 Tax=uncultured Thiohalocapsa sp. TaxID=768990 RepID=UPI0025DB9F7C|nr:BON domain-containing protein [uncultured Thiohalocapsa sp.]
MAVLAPALTATALSGCGPMVVAGATYSAAVVYDRRSAGVVIDDEVIELQARDAYFKNPDISERSQLKATSYNHTVLITGQAETAQIADRYARLVAQLPKVKQVYNEAEVGPMIGVGQMGKDAMLTSRAKLAIQSIKLPGFDALRVKVVTENGVVYLMGLVTPEEADATAEKVRRIPGVQRVVKIFEYIDPQRPNAAADTA